MAYEYDRFDDETGGGGAFVMGLIAGAVIGAGIGMLLAPKAGSDLRSQLGDTATRLRDRASEGYSAASSKVADLYNRRTGGTAPTGSEPFQEWDNDKPTVLALREIAHGDVTREVLKEKDIPLVKQFPHVGAIDDLEPGDMILPEPAPGIAATDDL